MVKLYQLLESTFKMRINSNSEIIPYIKKLSEMGKFDEPKKIAAIAILLDRLGKLEDEVETEKSLQELSASEQIDQEITEEATKTDEALLETTDIPMTGVADTIDDSVETKTVTEFTPEQLTDTPVKETQPDTSTNS